MSESWVPAVGEVVETKIGSEWVATCVDSHLPDYAGRVGYLYVRQVGRDTVGRLYPVVRRSILDVRKPSSLSPLPANVYADWLDDHGESRAAKKLREAFPLGS